MKALLLIALLLIALPPTTGCINWDGLYDDGAAGVPIWRLKTIAIGGHLITVNDHEVLTVTQNGSMTSDGIVGHIPATPSSETAKIARLRKSGAPDWFFTNDAGEVAIALGLNYLDEGTAFAIPQSQVPPRIAVYRLLKSGVHRYAFGDSERDLILADGWTLERTLGYVNP